MTLPAKFTEREIWCYTQKLGTPDSGLEQVT